MVQIIIQINNQVKHPMDINYNEESDSIPL